jgi:hypothetical protein
MPSSVGTTFTDFWREITSLCSEFFLRLICAQLRRLWCETGVILATKWHTFYSLVPSSLQFSQVIFIVITFIHHLTWLTFLWRFHFFEVMLNFSLLVLIFKCFDHGQFKNLSKAFTRSKEEVKLSCELSFAWVSYLATSVYLLQVS